MSNRTLVELNHDCCPSTKAIARTFGEQLQQYMRSADRATLPFGVTFKHMRHHSEPDPLEALREQNEQLLAALESAARIIHTQLSNAYIMEEAGARCRRCLRLSPFSDDRVSAKVVHVDGCQTLIAITAERLADAAISAAKGKP